MAAKPAVPPTGPIGMYKVVWLTFHPMSFPSSTSQIRDLTMTIVEPESSISASDPYSNKPEGSPTVRFASTNEEIEPERSLDHLEAAASTQEISNTNDATIKELTKTLQGSHLQERRMSHFAFEPVSLPASRVCFSSLYTGTS